MAAFFLSLVAFLSFWSQQKERNEQNNSLRNGIFRSAQHDALKYRHSANCLSLRQRRNATNRVLEEEARSDHTLRVSSYIRLTPASVARISYASCHPEHSEGSKTFLHKDISLTLNMTPPSPRKLFVFEAAPKRNKQSPRRGSPQRPHPQGVRIYTAYACICGKNLLRLLSP